MSPSPATTPESLADIVAKHEVPETVVKAAYLNVSTFATQDPLVFLNLCMCLDSKRVSPGSPARDAIPKWGLGMLLDDDQFNMSSVVEDVMRYVENEAMQALRK